MSLAIALFFGTNLVWPKGYAVGSALALLAAMGVLVWQRPRLQPQLRPIVASCLLMLLGGVWIVVYYQDPIRELDLPVRYLAAILLLWACTNCAPNLWAWWLAAVAGSLSGAGLALYETQILGMHRAMGHTGVIQFGNIGLSLGVFCAAGAVWAHKTLPKTASFLGVRALLLAGVVAGACISLASGSRGGWVALPAAIAVFAYALIPAKHAIKAIASLLAGCALASAVLWSIPSVQQRFAVAVSDIQAYQQGNRDTSLGLRFSIWHAAIHMIAQRPLAGWGSTNYQAHLQEGVRQGRYVPEVLEVANTHNNYLEAWVKYGALGLAGVIGLFASTFLVFARKLRHTDASVQAVALCGASLAGMYAVFSLTQIMLGRNNTLLFFLMATAALLGLMLQREHRLHSATTAQTDSRTR